jgi:hypothetical protein
MICLNIVAKPVTLKGPWPCLVLAFSSRLSYHVRTTLDMLDRSRSIYRSNIRGQPICRDHVIVMHKHLHLELYSGCLHLALAIVNRTIPDSSYLKAFVYILPIRIIDGTKMDRQTDTSVRVKRELSDPPAGREGNDDHQSSSYRYQHAPPPRPLIVHDYDNTAAHVKKEPTSPPLRPAPITSARDDASAPRERSTGTTSERGMMDPPSSPLGPPPTRSSHDHRRSITPETFYDADDALPPPPTKLGSEYTSPPEQSGSKQPQPSSSKPGAGAPAFLTGQVPAGKGKRKQAFEARVEKKKQKQLKAVAEAVYPGPEPPLGVSRKNYLESVKEAEDIVTTMFRRVIDSDPRNVYNWISPKAQLSIKQKTVSIGGLRRL